MRLRVLFSVLIAVVLSLSFAAPLEGAPGTAYDDSEATLPFPAKSSVLATVVNLLTHELDVHIAQGSESITVPDSASLLRSQPLRAVSPSLRC